MPRYLSPLAWAVVLVSYVVWQWVRRFRFRENAIPKWRALATLTGLSLATFSTALATFLLVHASYTGGYAFYDPVELFCIGFGFLAAILALVISLVGREKLGFHVAAVSAVNLLLWIIDALAQ
jgi:hypothetical protein